VHLHAKPIRPKPPQLQPAEPTRHLGVLDELARGNQLLHLLARHEVVVHAILLARPRRARRMRHGEAELRRERILCPSDVPTQAHPARSSASKRSGPAAF
jgi:hypothetical protein